MNKKEQIEKMLPHIKSMCDNCTMCRLGREEHIHNGQKIEPHVFSNMIVSEFVMIAQNPGFNECLQDIPLVGQSGDILEQELKRYNHSKNDFYITNTVHCHTEKNRAPLPDEVKACNSILQTELRLIRPKLVVTLGSFAFKALCPDNKYSESLGDIIDVVVSGVSMPVYPIYHPSPRNLAVKVRKDKFEKDIKNLCGLMDKLSSQNYNEHDRHPVAQE